MVYDRVEGMEIPEIRKGQEVLGVEVPEVPGADIKKK